MSNPYVPDPAPRQTPFGVEVVNLPDDPSYMLWLPLIVAVLAAVLAVAIQSWRDDKRTWRHSVRQAHTRYTLAVHQHQVNELDAKFSETSSAAAKERVAKGRESEVGPKRMVELLEGAHKDATEHAQAVRAMLVSLGEVEAALIELDVLVSDELSKLASLSRFEEPPSWEIQRVLGKGITAEVHPLRRKRRAAAREYARGRKEPKYLSALKRAEELGSGTSRRESAET